MAEIVLAPEEISGADTLAVRARIVVRRWEMDSMVRSETPEPADGDQSLGDLVALAAKDVSQLVRYEIDLAKNELKGDAKRVGLAAALGGVAAFVGCLVLILVCIAFAYGLITLGIWKWAAFLIVAGTCVLLAGAAVGIAVIKVRHLSGLRKTRKTVTEGLGMLRHDGQQPEIAARKPR
ncbi:MAG TPA: phage holin family protein [Streptosporangiaceae bacterium]|nr:phage holin family protein [Streptosporangiaceae bacterium]